MLGRLVGIFTRCGAESISIIVNEQMREVQEYAKSLNPGIPVNIVVKSTPSSMHSFYELSRVMQPGKFCLTTVDTIFREKDFKSFINEMEKTFEYDGVMAVTPYIDDEKPLYVETDESLNITAFSDSKNDGTKFISGGIYALNDKGIHTLEKCMAEGVSRMRNYQRALIADGLRLKAYPIEKILDVDHAGDIAKAEAFLRGED